MNSRLSTTRFRRRLTQYVKALVLLWIVACQFPLPLAHSHQAMLGDTLETHLREHHSCTGDSPADFPCNCSTVCADELHWHWLMPWDRVDEDGQSRMPQTPNLASSPMTGWMGNAAIECDSSSQGDVLVSESQLSLIWMAAEPLDLAPERFLLGRPPADRIAYAGVSLFTRLCVSRC